ncbi:non-ribosomal peptide synthetase [Pseudomonas nunensis]|uniref:Amino acid adenylation domain-containing protein n=4 Tax=Pseudomonas TaxID=286 RepID=A0ABY5EP51_9PSED|nr:non-ribosomal peptide synthetase [Pseudomonas nunensis]MCL5225673.1 amino acid adenylation domain-containing protein [Pseudomonas nunensis]UTO16575.1 amino acid adenylation domain-containing protein [Pseudomonas nunensis]
MFDKSSLRGTTSAQPNALPENPSDTAALAYWRERLADAPTLLELPTDRPRPAVQGDQTASHALVLDAPLSEGLKALGRRHGNSLFMTLLAGWAVVLARLSGQHKVMIGARTGDLGNTLPLRLSLIEAPSTSQLLDHTRAVLLGAEEHQDLPFEQLLAQLNSEHSPAYHPLIQVLFAWNHSESLPAGFDLTLVLAESEGRISGHLHYAAALFDAATIERFAGYLNTVLQQMIAQPACSVMALEMLDAAERQQLLHDWNSAEQPFDANQYIHGLFEAQVLRNPDAIAARLNDEALSYGELNTRANRLAHHLRSLGVGPDVRVGLCLERSLDMLVGVLAVLKAGGAYVPLDPTYPSARLVHMLADSAPVVVLTHGPSAAALEHSTVLDITDTRPWASQSPNNPDPLAIGLTPRHLAYVIYTSGSTGTPKGVMVEHRGLIAVSAAWEKLYALGEPLNHLQMAGFSFDVFSADLIRALGFGGTLVLCPRETLMDPPALYRLLSGARIGFADFVPAVLNPLLAWVEESAHDLSFMHTVVCGSDIWTAHSARQLRRLCGDHVQIVQAYGVTEASIDSTCFEFNTDSVADGVLPIGRALANTRIYLLDALGAPVPVGVAGELHIGGVGVARGYLNLPQLSAERFIDSPFVSGERLYRSGDLARYRADGNLEFLGRNDFQAKLRGLRLELGEIEARLADIAGVRESLVLLRQDTLGESRLVAYYCESQGAALSPRSLRKQLQVSLPDYMVPTAYVRLDALPLTANGKLDRTALPMPDAEAFDQRDYQPPQGPLEIALANIWAEVLGVERVGRQDQFFALGGHSLLVMRVLAQVRQQLGLEVAPSALFAAPVLEQFAERLKLNQDKARVAIAAVERSGAQTLSSAQQRLWFLAQMQGGNAAYHMPLNLRLRGPLQIAALERAFNQLVARHEALRTTFIAVEGEGRQLVASLWQFIKLSVVDLQGQPEALLTQLIDEEGAKPFDLSRGPLMRVSLVRLAEDEHVLLLTQHHIISDGWSMGVLTRELGLLYEAAIQDRDNPLPPLPVQYVDYAVWQRQWLTGEVLAEQSRYWRDTLSGAPVLLELPADHKRPPVQDYLGGFVPLVFDPTLTAQLKTLCMQQGTTLFMTLLAAWSLVLSRLSGQTDVVIGVPAANRTQQELEGLIGFFVNTLALRMTRSGSPSVAQWLQQARGVALGAQEHQDLPFEQVVELLNPPRSLAHSPLFQVLFAWEQDQDSDLVLSGLEVSPVESSHHVAKFDLQLALHERDGQIVGGLEYASGLFEPATVAQFGEYLRRVLTQMVENPEQPLTTVDLLSEEQHQQIVHDWNRTERDTSAMPDCVARFEAIARQTPQAVALLANDRQLSYGALNQAANRLAHYLIEQGVRPEHRVGLCLERSPEMVIGLLAILKAGAAYVPFDPAYPSERLAFMFSDAAPTLLLTQSALRDALPTDTNACCLDTDAQRWAHCPDTDPRVAVSPDNLGYVLYTSGSTGRPKGVAHNRRALDNLIAWQLDQAQAPGRVLQFASLNFDVSFQEICSTLCSGGSLLLMTEDSRKDLAALRPTLVAEGVQRAFLPFAVLQQLAGLTEADAPMPAGGCEIVTAGEALQINDELRDFVRGLGGAQLHNQYGPTETHVVSQFSLSCSDAEHWPDAPPIGRPIANARLYVLDVDMNPVPVGVAGELYIAGACLARGYLNRPDLTAERFVPDPFSAKPGARMYRSGDLAKFQADGNVQYLGRIDQQVKLRGFRIELGEIDSLLQQQPGVQEAAVLLREDVPGDKRLVAYVVGPASSETLRAELQRHLPEHMIPSAWVSMAQLPLTRNGKLDRQALPAPERNAGATYVAPRDDTEQRMADIWAEVLKCERVGIHDNFFELGGHSLLATRMIYAINQRMGAQLSLSSLFKTPVLMDLAAQVQAGRSDDTQIVPAFLEIEADRDARHEPFPLTDIQQAYWFGREATVSLGGVSAHGYEELRIPDFDAARFEQALNRMIQRHDMLRVVFLSDGTQQVLEQVPTYCMPRSDLRGVPADVAQQTLQATRERQSHQVLDASRWPLFEFSLSLLDDGITHLHISLDALIVDAASTQILARELMAFYVDPNLILPEPGLTFRDYVLAEHQLRSGIRYEQALSYWRERVTSLAPAPDLPLVRQPESIANPHFTRRDRDMPAAQWAQLKAVAKQFAVTPSVMLLTAFSEVLALWSRHPRFTLSLPLFNRLPLHPDVDEIIGDFTSLVLLEVSIAGAASFTDKARAVQAQLWQDIDHSVVSGVRVLRELSQARGVQQTAMPIVFNSTLSEAAPELAEFNLADALNAKHMHSITQTPQVWLDHTLLELEGRLLFNWDSIDELFPAGMIEEMFIAYNALLDRLLEPAAWEASTPQLLPMACLPAPLDTQEALPLMHELFERQALTTPDAVAVIAAQRQLTYGQLRTEARSLGALLQAEGVMPNRLVAVMMERGWEQVVATLAILYAGGAYLPIDPTLPAERVRHILERAEVSLVLTQPALLGVIEWPVQVSAIAVTDDVMVEHAPLQPVNVAPTDLAYVIYTSGSTGLPKGVVIDHRGAVNTLLDINRRFAVGPADCVLAISSLSFDLSVYDFFGTLAVGAAVVVLEPQLALDPAHWRDLIERHQVSLWNSVPALLGMLLEYFEGEGGTLPASLRVAMLSGDWIPLTLPQRLWALQPTAQLFSLGGATEASIWSICYPVQHVDPAWRSIPYGKALDHQRFYVLDEALQIRPTWVAGQLYIGGIGLAQGYWRDEKLSAGSFFPHPLTRERLYRTGDLGRLLPDGNIEFLGREDNQVKVQGYRIELGEIEAALNRHPGVQGAVVKILGSTLGEKRLAGYVLKADPALQASDFVQYLADKLPAYMVPSSFTFVDAWPLSSNGKVDKKRLPEPSQQQESGPALEVEGAQEQRLVAIVQGVLKRDAIAGNANLLNLGATSIDIVRISNALSSELRFRPHVAQLLAQPTLLHLIGMYRQSLARQELVSNAQQRPNSPEEVIEDPQQRAQFKADQRGRRTFAQALPSVALALPQSPAFTQRFSDYRSVRQYAAQPIETRAFAELLAALAQGQLDGEVKYQFPSAGGLYPIQAYLYVKPDRVLGVPGGAYYYDPREHRLLALDSGVLDPDTYDYFVNRPVYENAAFSLFFIADMAAIRPLYGERSRDFCHIETGAIAQLLSMTAVEQGLGLCGVGSIEEAQLPTLFDLGPSHQLIYSMVGGLRTTDEQHRAPVEAFAPDQPSDDSDIEEFEV